MRGTLTPQCRAGAVLRAKVSQLKWAVEFGNLALLQMPGGYGGPSKIPACARQRQASGLA